MDLPPLSEATSYSTEYRAISGPAPHNSMDSDYAPIGGIFKVSNLTQRDILDVLSNDPVDPHPLLTGLEVSLSEVLRPIYQSVGVMRLGDEQVGSCTLIAENLGIIPCHCIENIDVRALVVTFGFVSDGQTTYLGNHFPVVDVVDYDESLDYAIVRMHGLPGRGFPVLSIDPESTALSNPALLHYPIGKTLKVSVNGITTSSYQQNYLQAQHDSDYGSSGGAYINPSGKLVAIHLGSDFEPNNFNLMRYALPIKNIIDSKTNGVLNWLAQIVSPSNQSYPGLGCELIESPFVPRNYFDLEGFDRNFLDAVGYTIKTPVIEEGKEIIPGVLIDPHQKKHAPLWPTSSNYGGRRGSVFPKALTNGHITELAKVIANKLPILQRCPTDEASKRPPVETLAFDKTDLETEFYNYLKKTVGVEIGIEIGWSQAKPNFWEIHFFPNS